MGLLRYVKVINPEGLAAKYLSVHVTIVTQLVFYIVLWFE